MGKILSIKLDLVNLGHGLAYRSIHSRPENFKKVQAKKTHENKSFSQFCNYKNGKKSIFEVGKSLKLTKCNFTKNIFYLCNFTSFFYLDFLKFSVPLWGIIICYCSHFPNIYWICHSLTFQMLSQSLGSLNQTLTR